MTFLWKKWIKYKRFSHLIVNTLSMPGAKVGLRWLKYMTVINFFLESHNRIVLLALYGIMEGLWARIVWWMHLCLNFCGRQVLRFLLCIIAHIRSLTNDSSQVLRVFHTVGRLIFRYDCIFRAANFTFVIHGSLLAGLCCLSFESISCTFSRWNTRSEDTHIRNDSFTSGQGII